MLLEWAMVFKSCYGKKVGGETVENIIIIGASSGIGKELAEIFSCKGNVVGLVGRRETLLYKVADELPNKSYVKVIDISVVDTAIESLEELLVEMGNIDTIVVNAGVGIFNFELDWSIEKKTISTNVYGFTAMCDTAMKYFEKKGKGHLVGISSIDAIRGNGCAPAYAASKAFVANYLEGLRFWARTKKLPINITEVQPGFVETPMTNGRKGLWPASAQMAAQQIYEAIINKKDHVYVTKRWCLVAWLMKLLPGKMLGKFYEQYEPEG